MAPNKKFYERREECGRRVKARVTQHFKEGAPQPPALPGGVRRRTLAFVL